MVLGKKILITDNAHGSSSAELLEIAPNYRPLCSKGPVVIDDNVWIGEKVSIMPDVHIGKGVIVAANSVVTKDVPPYSIVGGVPAKVVKYRYEEETIDFLLKSEWWNKPIEWLEANYELFSNIDEFKRVINETVSHNG